MVRPLTFLSLLANLFPVVGMDNQNSLEISLSSQYFIYLGTCPDREKVEKAYGRTFPMNTIFVSVKFKPYNKEFGNFDLIPYDFIHQKNEADIISLTINGKQYTIRCKHLGNDHFWQGMKFEDLVKYSMDKFSKRADWYPAGKDSGQDALVREKVIDPKSYGSQHGENKSPYVQ